MKPSRQTSGSIVDGEFVMTAADFRCVADLIHADAGIALSDSKVSLVYSRMAKRLRALKMTNFSEYCAFVQSSDGADERVHMLGALTTNVTRFFREQHHFDHLERFVLLPALDAAKRGSRLRFWSSACSSGEEPYSIALTLLKLMPDANRYDIRILASDVDPNILATARRGIYPERAIADIPSELRRRWLKPVADKPDAVEMTAPVRTLVEFRSLNLIKEWPMRGQFNAIFCRNVMIYFDAQTQAEIWTRMVPLLPPAGVLYIGHSERVAGPAATMLRPDGITTYRRIEAGSAGSPL